MPTRTGIDPDFDSDFDRTDRTDRQPWSGGSRLCGRPLACREAGWILGGDEGMIEVPSGLWRRYDEQLDGFNPEPGIQRAVVPLPPCAGKGVRQGGGRGAGEAPPVYPRGAFARRGGCCVSSARAAV